MQAKRLVLGASGLIGQELIQYFGPIGTIGTSFTQNSPGLIPFDANTHSLDPLIKDLKPGSPVFFLIGMTEIDQCARDPVGSRVLNVDLMINHLQIIMTAGLLPIYMSSDSVFDGKEGNYVEESETKPLHLYGRQKLEIEKFLLKSAKPHLVLRLPKVVCSIPRKGTVFYEWVEAIKFGREIQCATDQVFSPISLSDLSRTVAKIIDNREFGLFHLAGPEAWSRAGLFDLLVEELSRYGKVTHRMRRCSIHEFPQLLEERPLNCSLNIGKLISVLGSQISIRPMREVCATVAKSIAIASGSHSK
jgi:dTDP-4-dehydrorhamnose reductase